MEEDPRLQIVGTASTMPLLYEKVVTETPDVAVVDWSLAAEDLGTAAAVLRSDLRTTSLIFLTSTEEDCQKMAILRLGARSVLSKRASAREWQSAVWRASISLPAKDAAARPDPTTKFPVVPWRDPEERILQLTPRERQLIPLVCGGMRNKAIAQCLGIAESTVWHHLTAVFTKLEVDDRLALAAFAYSHGLVVPTTQASTSGG